MIEQLKKKKSLKKEKKKKKKKIFDWEDQVPGKCMYF